MGALFSKPDMKVSKPAPMPDPDDAQGREAAERRRREIASRSGRSSTILSRDSGGGAGTGAYKNSLLGQAG